MPYMSSSETSSLKALQYLQTLRSQNGPPLHIHQQLCRVWKSSLLLTSSPHHRNLNDIRNLCRLLHPLRSSSSRDSFLEGLGSRLHLVPIRQYMGVGPTRAY